MSTPEERRIHSQNSLWGNVRLFVLLMQRVLSPKKVAGEVLRVLRQPIELSRTDTPVRA